MTYFRIMLLVKLFHVTDLARLSTFFLLMLYAPCQNSYVLYIWFATYTHRFTLTSPKRTHCLNVTGIYEWFCKVRNMICY